MLVNHYTAQVPFGTGRVVWDLLGGLGFRGIEGLAPFRREIVVAPRAQRLACIGEEMLFGHRLDSGPDQNEMQCNGMQCRAFGGRGRLPPIIRTGGKG